MAHDLIVIGTGPGGYVCAIKAAQLGLKVAVVEKRATHGGTCVNVGCIPSKALLHASEKFAEAGHGLAALGVEVGPPVLNLAAMQAHKAAVVQKNTQGLDFLMRKNGIEVLRGTGTIPSAGQVSVTSSDGAVGRFEARAIVIATGSQVAGIPGLAFEFDERRIVSSTGALEFDRVPGHLVVVGAGVIGLELGSVWARLGAQVTVIEYLDTVLGGMDGEVARLLQRLLHKQGLRFQLSTRVTGLEATPSGARVTVAPAASGDAQTLEADAVLVATGRLPCTAGLGLPEAGVELDLRGRVIVDERFQTRVPGIYAIGDCIAGPMLAHKAEDEGVAVAEILAGQAGQVNHDVIPSVVYTSPEVAAVGRTEEELKRAGIDYRVGKFPFSANGRARAMAATEGFVKILSDARSDRVLGAHLIGPGAGEAIHEIALLMEFGGAAEDLARTCHAHPTLAEAVREAAFAAAFGRAIHI